MAGPITFLRRLRLLFLDDERNLYTVNRFMADHKQMLVIVMDPQSDRIFIGHRGRHVNGRIRSLRGKTSHIVRDVLKASQFRFNIDVFIASVAEALKLPVPDHQQFYQFLDGAIFNIGKALKKQKGGKAAQAPPGSIPSPYTAPAREE